MPVELSPGLRSRIWGEKDWSLAVPAIAPLIVENEKLAAASKSILLRQLAKLSEFCVLSPKTAADLYSAAFQADRTQIQLLGKVRGLCQAMGRFDQAARSAELQYRHTRDPRFQLIAGQAWLDAGMPDRALRPLIAANQVSPGNPHVQAALEIAQRDWANPEEQANELIERARKTSSETPWQALKAARILRMLECFDRRYDEALQLCLQLLPNLPSACYLMETHLYAEGRLDAMVAHFERRANAAPKMATALLLHGSALLFRAGNSVQAGQLLDAGLKRAVQSQRDRIPSLLALLRALAASSSVLRMQVIEMADSVYDQLLSNDEKVGLCIFCLQISWRAQKDIPQANRWVARLQSIHTGDHPLIEEFMAAQHS